MSERREAKILFITEDRDEGKMVEIFLRERRNDTVITCNPNNQSPGDLIEEEPDLILITAHPWNFNALQLYQALRTIPEFKKTPVIFWRFLETPAEFYPLAQKIGAVGCIEYVFDIEKEFLVARDTVLAGGTFYPV